MFVAIRGLGRDPCTLSITCHCCRMALVCNRIGHWNGVCGDGVLHLDHTVW